MYQAISIKRLFIAISMAVFLILLISMLIFPIIWVDIYKEFFKSINLASDNVEIYLKDKNESIRGKLIFDDWNLNARLVISAMSAILALKL